MAIWGGLTNSCEKKRSERQRRKGKIPEELWTEVHDIVQEAVIKTIPKKKNAKRQNGCLRRPYK